MLRSLAVAAPPIALVLVGVLLIEPPALTPGDRLPTLRVLEGFKEAPRVDRGVAGSIQPGQNRLDIYWIDVEGGAATLIVTPERQSVLMDAGWSRDDDRDVRRIRAAIADAGITELDFFIASHFHADHVGGVPALAKQVPIGQFIDHGDSVEQDRESSRVVWEAYADATAGRRRSVEPGDTLPLEGVDFAFVTSAEAIPSGTVGHPNPHCRTASPGEPSPGENSHSVGYLLSLGAFQFLNLGDLTVDIQHALACPESRVGVVDLLQVPHHGNGVTPQLTWAVNPSVAVLSNGPHKGGSPEGFEVVRQIPDLEGIWQLHRALDTDGDHNASERMTANLTEEDDAGFWIKAMVQADGRRYTVVNDRNQYRVSYPAK